jgi:outer membrane protein
MRRHLSAFALAVLAAAPAQAIDLAESFQSALAYDAQFSADASAAEAGRELAVQGKAALRPRVSVSGQYNRVGSNATVDLPPEVSELVSTDATGDVYGYGVQLSQPLYRADLGADGKSLSAQAEISELAFRAARQNLILRVAQAYFEVLSAQDSLAFAQAQKAAVAEQLAASQARFDSGRARITDVVEAQASFDSLVAAEIAAENALAVARARFFALTGREGEDPEPLAAAATAAQLESLEAWLARARTQSIDVRVRALELEIAEAEIRRHRLAGRPQLDLVAKYEESFQDGELSQLAYPDRSEGKTVGLQFSMPVLAGGALRSRHRQAVAERNQAERQLEATRREVEVSTRQTHADVTAGKLRVAALEKSLESAEISLEAGELGQEVGTRTNLDVLTLRQQVYDAKRELADARYDYLLSRLNLSAVAGQLTENELEPIH